MKVIITSILLLISISIFSQITDESEAKERAISFLSQLNKHQHYLKSVNLNDLKLLASLSDTIDVKNPYLKSSSLNPLIYIFDINEKGFIIISGIDNTKEVLGYSLKNKIGIENISPQLSELLNGYIIAIKKFHESGLEGTVKFSQSDNVYQNVETLVQTHWNQLNPYNKFTPNSSPVGCTGVAMGQVIKYWADKESIKAYGRVDSIDFSVQEYNWGNMPVTLSGATDSEIDDLAQFLFHCAVSNESNFSTIETGASTYNTIMALIDNFSFHPKISALEKSELTTNDEWEDLLYENLAQKRPVIYSAASHAFICDGYKDGYFHFNLGWGGLGDGYYLLNSITPMNNVALQGHRMILDIYPSKNNIAKDTVWSGEVSIDDGIAVIGGAKLTIKPGSKILIDGHNEIFVTGSIECVGTEETKIEFSASDTILGFNGITLACRNENSIAKIQHCKIKHSHKNSKGVGIWRSGGGICEVSKSGAVISDVEFYSCSANNGGSLYLTKSGTFSNLIFKNGHLDKTRNFYTDTRLAVSVEPYSNDHTKWIFEDCACISNVEEISEISGIFDFYDADTVVLNRCRFFDNIIYNKIINGSDFLKIQNCEFYNNKAGELFNVNYDGSTSMINSLVHHNDCSTYVKGEGNLTVINSTIEADYSSQMIFNMQGHGKSLDIINSIIWRSERYTGNFWSLFIFGEWNVNVQNSIIFDGDNSIEIYGEDNILNFQNLYAFDPSFNINSVYPYSLKSNSLALNNGIYNDNLNVPEVDLAGNSRFFGETIDIGCYEFNCNSYIYEDNVSICEGETYKNLEQSGVYIDTISWLNGCDSIVTIKLTVHDLPNPNIICDVDTLRSDLTYASYQWYDEAGMIEGANLQKIVIEKSGIYYLKVTNEFGCKSISDGIEMIKTGLDEISGKKMNFQILPNPNDGNFKLKFENSTPGRYKVQIINVLGNVQLEKEFIITGDVYENEFKLSHLSKGSYFIRVFDENKSETMKIFLK